MKSEVFWSNRRKESLTGVFFVLPEIVGMLLLSIFPLVFSLYLSFSEWNLVSGVEGIKFVGLKNYAFMLQDSKFLIALKNNLLFTFVAVPGGIILALFASVIIHSHVFFRDFFKVAFFIPYISTTVAVAAIWAALFLPSQGPINQLLMQIGISNPPRWLADPSYALIAIIIIAVWANLGYKIIIYLAGLSNISHELYEASEIDGANVVQRFWRITVPLLSPTIFFLTITTMIASFKVFDTIKFLTNGGPLDSTNVIVFYIYEEGFMHFRMGYASALSWALFIIVAIFTSLTWMTQKNNVSYDA